MIDPRQLLRGVLPAPPDGPRSPSKTSAACACPSLTRRCFRARLPSGPLPPLGELRVEREALAASPHAVVPLDELGKGIPGVGLKRFDGVRRCGQRRTRLRTVGVRCRVTRPLDVVPSRPAVYSGCVSPLRHRVQPPRAVYLRRSQWVSGRWGLTRGDPDRGRHLRFCQHCRLGWPASPSTPRCRLISALDDKA